MFKMHLKLALRLFSKYKGLSLINISGLAISMTCCIIVSLYILDEISFDKQNKDASRIFRIAQEIANDNGNKTPLATTPPALATSLQKDIPEIEAAVRLFPKGWDNSYYVRYSDKKYLEENIYRADSSLFDVFTVKFKEGNAKTAMASPNSIILTESIAKKYFGSENPIGKVLHIDDWQPRIVTAVIADFPDQTHFKIDLIVTLASDPMGELKDNWTWNSFYTYIKLKPRAEIQTVERKISAVFKKMQPQSKNHLFTQPLISIHLQSHLGSELRANGDSSYIYIFGALAFFTLFIGRINYVNLATAQSHLREKEIVIKKICGAWKTTLVRQFLTEGVIFSFFAVVLSIGLTLAFLPEINRIRAKRSFLLQTAIFLSCFQH